MIDEQPRCGNPACGLPIVVLAGHRRRQYCNDACRMAAHRASIIAENQARYEASKYPTKHDDSLSQRK